MVVERHCMIGRRKNDGSGHQILWWSTGKIFRPRLPLRHGHVTCLLNELGKLLVCHVSFVYPETVHIDAVDGARMSGVAVSGRRAALQWKAVRTGEAEQH